MPPEQIYVQTNATELNEVAVFNRTADGTLQPAGRFGTDGLGTGVSRAADPTASTSLGVDSQDAVALSADRAFLFAVNGGSNDISSFAVVDGGLRLVGKTPSGGPTPVSIAVRGSLLYVANRFGAGGIAGFTVEADGQLSPLTGSERPLSAAGAAPAQVAFTRDGRFLVVTELATNRIVTYRVNSDGRTGRARSVRSSGQTPFGFAFDPSGRLIVSEAVGGTPQAGTVSSYRFGSTGEPVLISASVPTHQTGACWVVTTADGRYAYTSNTVSGSISGYRIDAHGNLTLLAADGLSGTTGENSFCSDMVISGDGRYLYVLNPGSETIGAFAVKPDGGLVPQPYVGGVPNSAVGMVIR
jgi:6-phosphogluconolactonase (cycloisomerase 2 family)